MPKLVIENGPDKGHSYLVRKEGVFLIGRDPAAQVPLRDEMASRRHCQIDFRAGRFLLRDLDSSNGVTINDEPVEGTMALSGNDRIEIGETRISFLLDDTNPLIAKVVGGCRIEKRIGRGGMGTVYRAIQLSLDRVVAMKVLSPHLTRDSNFVKLFVREARAAGVLSHPNIVQVYDVGVDQDVHYFSMEFVPNGSVEELLNREGKISPDRALEIVRQSALGLQYAELKGIVHRDIKPGNLMIGARDAIKIGDLGIARTIDDSGRANQRDGVSGSPHYIAPEQARGQAIDHRADIYSLGISLFHMLTGRTPFRGSNPKEIILKHIKESPPPIADLNPDLSPALVSLVGRMMSKNPSQRPSSAGVLIDEIAQVHREETTPQISPSPKRNWLLPLATAGALILVVAGVLEERQDAEVRESQIEQDLNRANDSLSRVRQAIDANDLDSASVELAALSRVPEALKEQTELLREEIAVLLDQRAIERRGKAAEELLSSLEKSEGILERPTDLIAGLVSMIEKFPDTPAAVRASRILEETRNRLTRSTAREESAKAQLNLLAAKAEGYSRAGNLVKARNELIQFDSSFADTEAGKDQASRLEQLDTSCLQRWQEVSRQVAEQLQQQRLLGALDLLAGFRLTAGLPVVEEELSALESRLEELRQSLINDIPGEGESPLTLALTEAWHLWLERFDAGPAIDRLRDIDLRTSLAPDLLEEVGKHERFLRRWKQTLTRLSRGTLGVERGKITLEPVDGPPFPAHLQRIENDRVYFRKSEGEVLSYLKWSELLPSSRLEVLSGVASSDEDHLFLALLLEIAGKPQRAAVHWDQVGEEGSGQIDSLKFLLERSGLISD